MDFQLSDEFRMLKELAEGFVEDYLIPLESVIMKREADGGRLALTAEEKSGLDAASRDLGLWGLDAPEQMGGYNLPLLALIGVNEALGRTVVPYDLPPDSPNLHMLIETANDEQRARYLDAYARGETISAMAISEPGAGSDPAALTTRAERQGEDWVLNGRKIWISRADKADWTIVMAVTDKTKGARGGISAFIVDRDTPGFVVERRIPMLGGVSTFEISLNECRIPARSLLGREGFGFAPMQTRLTTRRVQIAAWCIGRAQRALDMLCEYAPLRKTFGASLAERQTIQNWVADGATRIHACRLMTYEAAARIDRGEDARVQVAMIKLFATETAATVVDQVMQSFGAMGMTKEMPLYLMANESRLARIYEGPSEIHRYIIARELLGLRRR